MFWDSVWGLIHPISPAVFILFKKKPLGQWPMGEWSTEALYLFFCLSCGRAYSSTVLHQRDDVSDRSKPGSAREKSSKKKASKHSEKFSKARFFFCSCCGFTPFLAHFGYHSVKNDVSVQASLSVSLLSVCLVFCIFLKRSRCLLSDFFHPVRFFFFPVFNLFGCFFFMIQYAVIPSCCHFFLQCCFFGRIGVTFFSPAFTHPTTHRLPPNTFHCSDHGRVKLPLTQYHCQLDWDVVRARGRLGRKKKQKPPRSCQRAPALYKKFFVRTSWTVRWWNSLLAV